MKLLVIITAILAIVAIGVAWVARYVQSLLKTPVRITVVPAEPGGGTQRVIQKQYW